MTHAESNPQPGLRADLWRVAGRAVWLGLIAGHAWPTLTALLAGDALRSIILLACQAAFLLKLIDLPILRLPETARGRWALAVIVILMHGRVIADSTAIGADALTAIAAEAVVVISVGALLAGASGSERRPARRRTSLIARIRGSLGHVPPRFELLLRSISLQRPPPACA